MARHGHRHPGLRWILSRDLAVDLGTSNTLIHVAGEGVVVNEPSVVAIDVAARRVRAVGADAKRMLGRVPESTLVVRPLREGAIADFEATEAMLRAFVARASRSPGLIRPRVLIAVPSCITPVERRAVQQSARLAGAREVYLIEQAVAAAVGAGLPVEEAPGNLVVDVGGGTTEVAVLALGGTVCWRSARTGGDAFDEAIVLYMRRKHDLVIGAVTAERVKLAIGSALSTGDPRRQMVHGRDAVRGMPRGVEVSSEDIREALEVPLQAVARVVSEVLEGTPPELASDVLESGMVLTGGGALLPGLDRMLADRTGLPVMIADQPLETVVSGAGECLASPRLLRRLATRAG